MSPKNVQKSSVFIDKTTYLAYRQCPKNAWLKVNKPELHALFELSEFEKSLSDMGHMVEVMAQKMFPDAVKDKTGDSVPVLFQPTFIFEGFLARADVMAYDTATNLWNLYEIKASNSLKNTNELDYIEDVAFQSVIIRNLSLGLGKIFIIYLNKEYIRGDELDIKKLFVTEDATERVMEREKATLNRMHQAKKDILEKSEQELACECIYTGRSAHCTTFAYSHPKVPKYSVHDLARIGSSKNALHSLIDDGIYGLGDIPPDFHLTEIQRNQVMVYQTKRPFSDHKAIKGELAGLQYPLYFLDYETYASAVPLFKGFSPFQQIPFQFSLHVVEGFEKDSDVADSSIVDNFEYLHQADSDPSLMIIEELHELIGPKGSIIVWNKSFEQSINEQLAERHPEHKNFLDDVNKRIYDLRDIFTKQLYVHHGFEGKTSIKKVLPVLVPEESSHKDLEIKEGASASKKWYDMVFGNDLVPTEKEIILKDLMDYCGLDTYAMYAIWRFLCCTFLPNLLRFSAQ
ncbi:MAG: DUF2779 domain-containing protein [Candidatus Taylorbacteria bacterium]|nr:DUF2779 domain-containing protein [Candidatus Taylorbacteria bacterium]